MFFGPLDIQNLQLFLTAENNIEIARNTSLIKEYFIKLISSAYQILCKKVVGKELD